MKIMKSSTHNRRRQRAFTLLEVLIVISIIGILIALGVAAYSTAQRKGRDARRQADIKSLQSGFEQFKSASATSAYPLTTAQAAAATTIFPSGLPVDPRNTESFVYSMQMTADNYCVCALLEGSTGNATTAAVSSTCSYGAGNYYCLSNLQ